MISNILEMRHDYDTICERVSMLRELPTREERIAELRAIAKDHKIIFEVYALIETVGREFL